MKRAVAQRQLEMLAHALHHASQMLAARQIRLYRVSYCLLRGNGAGHDLLFELCNRRARGESLQQLAAWLEYEAINDLVVEE